MFHLTPDDVVETTETLYIGKNRNKLCAQTIIKIVEYSGNGFYIVQTPIGTFSLSANFIRKVGPVK